MVSTEVQNWLARIFEIFIYPLFISYIKFKLQHFFCRVYFWVHIGLVLRSFATADAADLNQEKILIPGFQTHSEDMELYLNK